MSALDSLEKSLDEVFVKNAPDLPANAKKFIVKYLPIFSLIIGLLSLLATWSLWHWAHVANNLINYANNLSAAYGGQPVIVERLTATVWVGLAVLAVQAVLYIAAYSGLKKRSKAGWNLLFYALIINVVYGIVVLFTDYGGVGSLILSIIETGVGLYFLFQIRDSYKKSPAPAKKA